MNIQELLQGIDHCNCGKSHRCPIDHVIIEKHVCDRLPTLVSEYSRILLVADRNTYKACGQTAAAKLSNKLADTLIYEAAGVLVPDEKAIAELQAHLNADTDLIIGVGSGVINDLCKLVSFQNALPYFIIATATSMDGYASVGSALILDGMKVTLNAQVPKAILADIDVLADAPHDMIKAGYGDIIGKYSCLNDWQLSALVNGEYLCRTVLNATYEAVEATVALADGIRERDPQAVGSLMEALVAVGILMAYVGNSRPASGSEHHMSHYFEILGILRREDYFPHGIDVCFSAIETARLREELCAVESIDSCRYRFDKAAYEAEIRRIYGTVADEVLALQEKMGWYAVDRVEVYHEKWQEIRKLLKDCPSSAAMQALAEKVGLSVSDFYGLYGKDKIADGLRYAKDLKDRYSVLWLYDDLARSK